MTKTLRVTIPAVLCAVAILAGTWHMIQPIRASYLGNGTLVEGQMGCTSYTSAIGAVGTDRAGYKTNQAGNVDTLCVEIRTHGTPPESTLTLGLYGDNSGHPDFNTGLSGTCTLNTNSITSSFSEQCCNLSSTYAKSADNVWLGLSDSTHDVSNNNYYEISFNSGGSSWGYNTSYGTNTFTMGSDTGCFKLYGVQPDTAVLASTKSTNETVSSTALQDDDALQLNLNANSTYIVDGSIVATTSEALADFKFAVVSASASSLHISYVASDGSVAAGEMLAGSGTVSRNLPIRSGNPLVIHLSGTVASGSGGDFKLQWAEGSSNSNAISVVPGSYLRAQELQ